MAAHVTVASGYPKTNINGSSRELYYKFNVAADADWLIVPMRTVENVEFTTNTDTDTIGVDTIAVSGFGSKITLDTSGAINNIRCRVTGK